MPTQLTVRHQAFVDEYLNNGRNATKAYMSVYKPKTQRVAEVSGGRLFRNVAVQAYIAANDAKQNEVKKISKQKYLDFLDSLVNNPLSNTMIDNSKVAIEAIKIIGKWEGFEAPDKKQNVDKDGNPVDPIQNITINIKDNTNES